MLDLDDTIAAVATAIGAAGLAVVRVSGSSALAIAEAVFEGARLSQVPGGTLHHGWAARPEATEVAGADGHVAAGRLVSTAPGGPTAAAPARVIRVRLDEVVAAVFRAPRSYTRQDVVEFSCHGGALSAGRVLAALLAAGARQARPGEFTLRAFLNGRLDLAQAEAVADLIHAETEGAHALALGQLRGELSRQLATICEALRDAAAEVEARVDFAEDVGGVEVPGHVIDRIAGAGCALTALLDGAAYGRALREGVRVVLVGRPNVGKSSLFNVLVGERRAIVTPHAGTTRDLVSEAIEVAGVRVTLADTAGLREGGNQAESEGVARARTALEESAVVLWVVDASVPLDEEDCRMAARLAGRRVILALNKCDLPRTAEVRALDEALGGGPFAAVATSAIRGDGISELRSALGRLLAGPGGLAGVVANPRHVEALGRARGALERAHAAAVDGAPGEIVSLELREALQALGEVTGETVDEDLLERIFSRFCIGK
jgi:tRNA modification GTPase